MQWALSYSKMHLLKAIFIPLDFPKKTFIRILIYLKPSCSRYFVAQSDFVFFGVSNVNSYSNMNKIWTKKKLIFFFETFFYYLDMHYHFKQCHHVVYPSKNAKDIPDVFTEQHLS